MAERIHVVPDELRAAARHHRETADELRTVPSDHHDIMASLDSLGPIFSELQDAGRELLDQRRACYERQPAPRGRRLGTAGLRRGRRAAPGG